MSSLEQIKSFVRYLWSHRSKLFVILISFTFFLFILFPTKEVTGLISTMTAEQSQGQLFVQFDDIQLGLIPLGVQLHNVYVEAQKYPSIKSQTLQMNPSLGTLFSLAFKKSLGFKIGGSVEAEGFLKGNLKVQAKEIKTTEKGSKEFFVELQAQKISLEELNRLLSLPIPILGDMNIQSTAQVDMGLNSQPQSDLDVKINNFEMPPADVDVGMGDMTLPSFRVSQVTVKARLSEGQIFFEEIKLGQTGDEIIGTIKGKMGFQLRQMGTQVKSLPGFYDFQVDIIVQKTLQERAALFLNFLDGYKSPAANGAFRYALKISATGLQSVPRMSRIE